MSQLSLKAILWGSAIDICGSLLAGALVAMAFGVYWAATGVAPSEMPARMIAMQTDMTFLLLALAVGLAFTALGGFVAARLAPHRKLLNAGITAIPCIALGVATLGSESARVLPAWFQIASNTLVIPAAVLGGLLVKRVAVPQVNSRTHR